MLSTSSSVIKSMEAHSSHRDRILISTKTARRSWRLSWKAYRLSASGRVSADPSGLNNDVRVGAGKSQDLSSFALTGQERLRIESNFPSVVDHYNDDL